MSSKKAPLGPRVRSWFNKHVYYDFVFGLRERSRTALKQLLTRIGEFANPKRRLRAPKPKMWLPQVELLEVRQMPSTFGFAASSCSTGEQIGYATVNIDRSDSSGSATVYASDTS